MALEKTITQPDGIDCMYHRIVVLAVVTNEYNSIEVCSYSKKEAREREREFIELQRKGEDPGAQVYTQTDWFMTPYDQNMTIAGAYEWLKKTLTSSRMRLMCLSRKENTMRTYEVNIMKRRVRLGEQMVVAGGSNADRIRPSFDFEWSKLAEEGTIYAVFTRDHQTLKVECHEGDKIAIPAELLTRRGTIDLSFYGASETEVLNTAIEREAIYVLEGGPTGGEVVTTPDTPDTPSGDDGDNLDYATDDELREALGLGSDKGTDNTDGGLATDEEVQDALGDNPDNSSDNGE